MLLSNNKFNNLEINISDIKNHFYKNIIKFDNSDYLTHFSNHLFQKNKSINPKRKLLIDYLYNSITIELLSKPFDLKINNKIIQEILDIGGYIQLDYICEYYLYFCESNIIEKIHWSYLNIRHMYFYFDKIKNIKKNIDIICWNQIYFSDVISILFKNSVIPTSWCNNEYKKIYKDYLINLGYINSNYSLEILSSKYSKIIKEINKKNIIPQKINLNQSKLIQQLIVESDNVFYDKIIKKYDKKIIINNITFALNKQNISETKIIKILNKFEFNKNKDTEIRFNNRLFCNLLLNGYATSIIKIWNNTYPIINYNIYRKINWIIVNDNHFIFNELLKNKILDNYLYLINNKNIICTCLYLINNKNVKYTCLIWYNILFFSNKIVDILIKYKYEIPKNIFMNIINNISKKKINRNANKKYNNFLNNISKFGIPLNNDILMLLIIYIEDEQIIKLLKNNKAIDIFDEQIIGTLLNYNKFNIIDELFKLDEKTFNKELYKKNFYKYIKYIKNINSLSSVYMNGISKYNIPINSKIINYALKYKKNNLIKKIISKKKLISIKNIKQYLFGIKGDENFSYYNRFEYNEKSINLIYTYLKSNIINWNQIYSSNFMCDIIIRRICVTLDDIKTIYISQPNFELTLEILYMSVTNIDNKLEILKWSIKNGLLNNKCVFNSDDLLYLLQILVNTQIEIDILLNNEPIIKKFISDNICLIELLNFINSNLPNQDYLQILRYFNYFVPNIYVNTIMILLYTGTEQINIIKYYLNKCPYVKEKTYNYILDYYTYIKNHYSESKYQYWQQLIIIYSDILDKISPTNIIYPNDPLYLYNIYGNEHEHEKCADYINIHCDWIYEHIQQTHNNKILDEI